MSTSDFFFKDMKKKRMDGWELKAKKLNLE
jgi:hypothetical protein